MKDILQIVFSWPLVIIVGLIIFRGSVVQLFDRFIHSDTSTAKLGPLEIELGKLADTQKEQEAEITTLQFLVSNFVTRDEFKHLQALVSDKPFPFQKDASTPFFEKELRRLRAFNLIEGLPGKGVRSLLKHGGDVKDHFRIAPVGVQYLELREKVDEKSAEKQDQA
jgi:hypothetical protein